MPTSDSDGGRRTSVATQQTVVVCLRLPKLTIVAREDGKLAAEIATRLIAELHDVDAPDLKGELYVETTDAGLQEIKARALKVAESRTLRRATGDVLQHGSADIVIGGIRFQLRFEPKASTTARRPAEESPPAEPPPQRPPVPDPIVDKFRSQLRSILNEVPQEFAARRKAIRDIHSATREELALAYEPLLNQMAQSLPHATYEDKKTLAVWVSSELRELGLTIRCPKTGEPAILRAHGGGRKDVGRFHLETTDARGIRHRPVTSVELPSLALMPADLSRASYAERPEKSR